MITVWDTLTLTPILRCPWCKKIFNSDPDTFAGVLTCAHCDHHWWATRLRGGDLRAQLLDHCEGDAALVVHLMVLFTLPETIPDPGAFWQIRLAGRQSYRYHKNPDRGHRSRSAALIRGVVELLRHAS